MPLHISAIFATMDRVATAIGCLRALAAQSRPPDLVVVADNGSGNELRDAVAALGKLPFDCVIHPMGGNGGNAGGVAAAMDVAWAHESDAVWILDDDSWPRPGALAAMLATPWDPAVMRHALQVDPRNGRFTWPLQVSDGRGGWRLAASLEDMPPETLVTTRISWTGSLISRLIWEKVGPVNADLFIRGEDEDYPWRIEKAGFVQQAVTTAILDHPGPERLLHWKWGKRHFFFEPGLADWKIYYKVRNMVWLRRQQAGGLRAIVVAAAYALASLRLEGRHRLPLIWEAIADGWRGRLGKWRGSR